jgi:hypothetical protein
MKTFTALVMMIAGGVIFGGDPDRFSSFGCFHFPGHIVVGTALIACGILFWARSILE